MPEMRKDPITGRWVILAPERAQRPVEIEVERPFAAHGLCPFCEGNERHTPSEVQAYRDPGTKPNERGWRVRVVPNRFPALRVEGDLNLRGDGIYDVMHGLGAHEVIIECSQHETHLSAVADAQIRDVLSMYRERLLDLKRDLRMAHGLVFKNSGAAAGASLEHAHSQLIVLPFIPAAIREEVMGAEAYFRYRGRCIFCDIVREEGTADKRIVLDTPNFLCLAPYASRFPFETWILPKHHESHYESLDVDSLLELGTVMKSVLHRLDNALDRPAYNYYIHSAPFTTERMRHYHWHIEIFPRLTGIAGFEWGAGVHINTVYPEEAAHFLRRSIV
jgi:UDPglucose--hexose-1-phosphate uridylyltransferase